MTEALTRAARAIRTFYLGGVATETGNRVESCFVGDPDAIARAAILSFLSGEDVVEACARALAHEDWTGESAEFRATRLEVSAEKAQRAIAALRALVQEDGK